jgi:recombination protein RecR
VQYSSQIIENATEALSSFPGIGKRTALRLVMHLIKRPDHEIVNIADSIMKLKTELHLCQECFNIADSELCNICNNKNRDQNTLCIIEDYTDLMAIENTMQYSGNYFVLGGLIAPIDGIGPEQLKMDQLVAKVIKNDIKEVILALNTTVEGDTTLFYIAKILKPYEVKVSTISRGVSVGAELEYADELTLGNSILNRIEYIF